MARGTGRCGGAVIDDHVVFVGERDQERSLVPPRRGAHHADMRSDNFERNTSVVHGVG